MAKKKSNARKEQKLHHSVLEYYPDHVKAIGMISIELSNLEMMLGELLGALLHIHAHLGAIIYLTPQSNMARLTILERIIKASVQDGSEGRKLLDKLVERVRACVGKRHDLIHNAWGLPMDDPSKGPMRHNLPFAEKSSPKPVSLAELEHLIKEMRTVTILTRAHTAKVYSEWPPYTSGETPS